MTENTSTFGKFILGSAEKYLQTIVLIDDRIYDSKSGSVSTSLLKPAAVGRKVALKSAAPASEKKDVENKLTGDGEKPDEVSFHEVQNSFAKKRIICSLYQPQKKAGFGPNSDAYKLCSSADVVVVDWDLHGDDGVGASILVGTLIEQSKKEIPHQLRLVLIYTTEPNLGRVANTIYEDIVKRIGEDTIKVIPDSEGLILSTDNARVVVLGKFLNTSLTQYKNFWVPEKDLAVRTISEFSKLASGLLQGIVLRGVAYLRENNRRILMRFNESLDAAFLTHRALLLPDEEACGHIIPLLTDELRAVLEDTMGNLPLGNESELNSIVADWCDKQWKPGSGAEEYTGEDIEPREFAAEVFCLGPKIQEKYSKYQKGRIPSLVGGIKVENGHFKWGDEKKSLPLADFLLGDCQGDSCHQELSSLMSQREIYDDAQRTLHLGVIVREISREKRLLLCLQPVCDSVRMRGEERAFVFCYLQEPVDGKPFTHTVMDIKRKLIRLKYEHKASHCFTSNFKAKKDTVIAPLNDNKRFIFQDVEKNEYEWIAELKTQHAQRAAEEFGRTLSRVGLTEFEWLRLKAKQS